MEGIQDISQLLQREPQHDNRIDGGDIGAAPSPASSSSVTGSAAAAFSQARTNTTTQHTGQPPEATPAATATNAGTSAGTSVALSAPSVIVFDINNNFDNGRVFLPEGHSDFQWKKDSSVTIKDIVWLAETVTDDFKTLDNTTVGNSGANDTSLFKQTGDSSTILEMERFADPNQTQWQTKLMYIKIDWETDFAQGYTQSSYFIVASKNKLRAAQELIDGAQEDTVAKNGGERIQPLSSGSDSSSTTSSSPEKTSTSKDDNSGGGGGGGGGLATGAIAGIAVGGAVVLLLIGGLIWFFLRRKRRNKDTGKYDSQPASSAFMAEKETRHTVDSPYSDDGHTQQAAVSSTAHQREAFMPQHTEAMGSRPDVASGGAQTPQGGVSRSVAHLVEDGMTEDEIRRLEAEERQLDDEIERAGRR